MGGVFCAAASPIIGTIVLGREMTAERGLALDLRLLPRPVGWLIADRLVPPQVATLTPPPGHRAARKRCAGGRRRAAHVDIPPPGETRFVPDEVLLEFRGGATSRALARMARRLHLTRLETQRFALIDRTMQRLRIEANTTVRSDAAPDGALSHRRRRAAELALRSAAGAARTGRRAKPAARNTSSTSCIFIAAHRITNGDDVLVAVIDSEIDTHHPDLAGVLRRRIRCARRQTRAASARHGHGRRHRRPPQADRRGAEGAAARGARFSGSGESAQGTTFNVMKGLDWAAGKNARIVNMSFAGPADSMFADMLAKAYARGMVLIAAVGNAGPRSPPLYPAAYRDVIGVTATDADDKLLPQAKRGRQVAVAAPGVDILVPAPGGSYQLTSGTSVAAAHVSGVAALLLARNPKLSPYARAPDPRAQRPPNPGQARRGRRRRDRRAGGGGGVGQTASAKQGQVSAAVWPAKFRLGIAVRADYTFEVRGPQWCSDRKWSVGTTRRD